MKERYILNPLSKKILHTGMLVCIAAYFFVMLDIYRTVNSGAVIIGNVYTMIEHISATVMLIVGGALLLDVHIKQEK